ncbi:hypothetical protein QL285_004478 [Trifolium repens]|nr:hypothetical protein QL285_004478 [Trifolium repens]
MILNSCFTILLHYNNISKNVLTVCQDIVKILSDCIYTINVSITKSYDSENNNRTVPTFLGKASKVLQINGHNWETEREDTKK